MKLLFWLTFLSLALVASGLPGQLLNSVFVSCYMRYLPKDAPARARSTSNCADFTDKVVECIENSISISDNIYDQIFLKNIDTTRLTRAFKFLCEHLGPENRNHSCLPQLNRCFAPYTRELKVECYSGIISCVYSTLTACNSDGGLVPAMALMLLKNPICTLESYQFHLTPFYGPGSKCYPSLSQSSAKAASKLGPYLKSYCDRFNKEEIGQCVETGLKNRWSPLMDEKFVRRGKEFFKKRTTVCGYFKQASAKTCPDVDISSCQKSLFNEDQNDRSALVRVYAKCIHELYVACDPKLAKVIKYNLDGQGNIETTTGAGSGAVQWSLSSAVMVSQAVIILSLFY